MEGACDLLLTAAPTSAKIPLSIYFTGCLLIFEVAGFGLQT